MLPNLYSHLLNGFLLSVLLVSGLRCIAKDLELVDLPDGRKSHSGEIPLCGGLAIFSAFILTGIGFEEGHRFPWHWEVGFIILVLIGVADDRWHLSPLPRLTVEAIGATILVLGAGGSILVLGHFASPEKWHLSASMAAFFSVFFIVGTINAVNMLDGADGVAGASAAVMFFWLALVAIHVGNGLVAMHALVLIAAIVGFLIFNMRHPWRGSAEIFMGEAGTATLGGALATYILFLCSGDKGLSFVALMWLVAVPVLDTLSLIVRRVAIGRSPLSADRSHLHHLLLDAGVSPLAVVPIIAGASTFCGAVAYTGIAFDLSDTYLALGLSIPVLVHTGFVLVVQGRFPMFAPGRLKSGALHAAHRKDEVIG